MDRSGLAPLPLDARNRAHPRRTLHRRADRTSRAPPIDIFTHRCLAEPSADVCRMGRRTARPADRCNCAASDEMHTNPRPCALPNTPRLRSHRQRRLHRARNHPTRRRRSRHDSLGCSEMDSWSIRRARDRFGLGALGWPQPGRFFTPFARSNRQNIRFHTRNSGPRSRDRRHMVLPVVT